MHRLVRGSCRSPAPLLVQYLHCLEASRSAALTSRGVVAAVISRLLGMDASPVGSSMMASCPGSLVLLQSASTQELVLQGSGSNIEKPSQK